MNSWNSVGRRAPSVAFADTQLDFLQGPLGPRGPALLASLRRETDPDIFYSGLLQIGTLLEEKGERESALRLYQSLQNSRGGLPELPEILRGKINRRSELSLGRGPWGLRVERLLGDLSREAVNPSGVLGFAAAQAVLGPARCLAFHHLGSRLLAQGIGLAAEGAAFALTGQAVDQVLGRHPDWDSSHLSRDLASTWILLGAMRLLPKTVFGGIVLGHGLQGLAGLRPSGDFSDLLWASFATYLQARVGGELNRRFFGRSFSRAEWEDRWNQLGSRPGGRPPWQAGGLAWAETGGLPRRPILPPKLEYPLAPNRIGAAAISMTQGAGGGGKTPTPQAPAYRKALRVFRSLQRRDQQLAPQDAVPFLIQMGIKLDGAGGLINSRLVLSRARERAAKIELPQQAINAYTQIAKAEAKMGHLAGAQDAFALARKHIAALHPGSQPNAYATLGNEQAKVSEGAAAESFIMAESAIGRLPPPERPGALETLALIMAQSGRLEWARALLNQNPEGKKLYGLSELAKQWGLKYSATENGEFLSYASVTFQEAYAEVLRCKEIYDAKDVGYRLAHLTKAALDAGPWFQSKGLEWLGEYQSWVLEKVKDPASRNYQLTQVGHLLAKAGAFKAALDWIRTYSSNPDQRSGSLKILALKMIGSGQMEEAVSLLKRERFYPSHVFEAWISLADAWKKSRPPEPRKYNQALIQAGKLILKTEFYPHWVNRPLGLLWLAQRWVGQAGDRRKVKQIISEIRSSLRAETHEPDKIHQTLAEIDLLRLEVAALPLLSEGVATLMARLDSAAQAKNFRKTREISAALGFRSGGLEGDSPKLHQYPPSIRGWAKAWFYYGAALHPRPEESRKQIAKILRDMVVAHFYSEGPWLEKSHVVALQAMRLISPNLLQMTLIEEIRNLLEFRVAPTLPRGVLWLNALEFPDSNRILFQSLSWLARFGSVVNKAFVSDLLSAPNFPQDWKGPIGRSLQRHGFQPIFQKRIWN